MKLDLSIISDQFKPAGVLALTIRDGVALVAAVTPGGGPPAPFPLELPDGLDAPEAAGRGLASALAERGIRQRRCVVSIPPSWALAAAADLPEVGEEDLRGYFELRAEREFSASGLRLAHSRFQAGEGPWRATLAGVPAKRIEAVEKMLAAAGCRAVSISLALEGALDAAEPTLFFWARRGGLDLAVSAGGGIALLRSIPADNGALSREIRITLGRLPEPLAVKAARWVGPPRPDTERLLEPFGIGRFSEQAEPERPAAEEAAARFLAGEPVPFEFVVAEVSRWPRRLERLNTRRGRLALAGAGGLAALLLGAVTIPSFMESRLEAEWRAMSGRVEELGVIQQKIRQYRPWFTDAPQKLRALEALFAAFPERGEIWARSVQASAPVEKTGRRTRGGGPSVAEGTKVSVSGYSRSQAALMALQERLRKEPGVGDLQLQQLRGNNPIQFSLTFKWEPKHDN